MSRPRITFLCRGSTSVGLGHVMRTRTVADAVAAHDRAVVRVVAIGDDAAGTLLRDRPYPVVRTEDDDEAVRHLTTTQPHVAVLDTTTLSPAHYASVAAEATVASLSPVFDRLEAVDVLFHRTRRHPLGPRPGWRLGPDWAVVRPECSFIEDCRYDEAIAAGRPLPVAVCLGGADAPNATLRVLEALRRIDRPLLIWALLGEGYRHSFDELEQAARADRRHEVILARTTDSMWRVLRPCAVAVLASGTVTYEAAAVGLPSINLTRDPAHAYLLDDLVAAGAAFHGGQLDGDLTEMTAQVRRLEEDRPALLTAHHASRRIIDGGAAHRIAEALLGMVERQDLERGLAVETLTPRLIGGAAA